MFNLMVAGMMGSITSPVTGTNTAALLHFDGSDGGTTFTDETAKQTWTASGSAALSTTQKKFGTASFFSGTNQFVLSSSAVNCGVGDFTIEAQLYLDTATSSYISFSVAVGDYFEFYWNNASSRIEFRGTNSSSGFYVHGNTTLTLDTFHHVAFVKKDGIGKIFLNGNDITSTRFGTVVTPNFITYIGFNNNVYIDEFRASSIARYTSNFTPPVAAFTVD